jgi:hypothetical protein
MAGLEPGEISAHGPRLGVPLLEAMQQSRHRSVQQAAEYYNPVRGAL